MGNEGEDGGGERANWALLGQHEVVDEEDGGSQ